MSSLINDLCKYILENNVNVSRISVIRKNGKTRNVELKKCNPCQNSYSISKMFILTAIGLLYDDGKLKLEEKVTDILASYCPENMSDRWKNITVDMVIRHHCGLPKNFLDIDCNSIYDFKRDFLLQIFEYPIEEPDEYIYTDAAYYLLGRIVSEITKKSVIDFLWERLFYKLKFQEVAWSCCPNGYVMGGTGLYTRTEDMVKLGALYMFDGEYDGEQILSKEWVKLARDRKYIGNIRGSNAYGQSGMNGQLLAVLPNQGLTIAWHAYTDKDIVKWFVDYINKK